MNEKELTELIKSEGDEKNWTYTCKNGLKLDCSIHRSSILILCGYVHLSQDSSLWGIDYEDLYKYDIDVHGGLTYSGHLLDRQHWTLGFDCGHYRDLVPYYMINTELYKKIENGSEYRDMIYVIKETELLAEQLSKYSLSELRIKKIDNLIN